MWIFLNNAFLSIVQKPGDTDTLTVRARVKGDIERVFPTAKVTQNGGTDYKFRATIHRARVADAMFDAVMDIDYANFKSSVKDHARHDAYMDVWSAMMKYQIRAGAAAAPKRGKQTRLPY